MTKARTQRKKNAEAAGSGQVEEFIAETLEVQEATPEALLLADRKLRDSESKRRDLDARYKAALAQIAEQNRRIENLTGLSSARLRKQWSKAPRTRSGQACAVVNLSDWHVEETVLPASVNGLNEYNLDIADKSIQTVFQRVLLLLEDARGLANVREMVVHLGGDMISGYLHEEQLEGNSLAPLPACRWVAERIDAGLRMILAQGELRFTP